MACRGSAGRADRIADRWWRGPDSLVAVYRGESQAFGHPSPASVHIYSGLDEWGQLMTDEDDTGEHAIDDTAKGSSDGFLLTNGQNDRYENRDTVQFSTGLRSLRQIIDSGTRPEDVRRESDR